MSELSRRIANLSPEKRALLTLRLDEKREASQLQNKESSKHLLPNDLNGTKTDVHQNKLMPHLSETFAEPALKINKEMKFSLFFFSSDESKADEDKYRLLIESVKFADSHGFHAVWTPERHFHAFGGLYPNPSVISTALAMVTEQIQLRAGSVVLPLHHPIRVAEEWSVVDNLSKGRVGIAFASGWHANDFVFSPESYTNRKEVMFHAIQTVQQLWQGESIWVRGGAGNDIEVELFPKPVQHQLPVWITTGGNPKTFVSAGEHGAYVLTNLLGQTIEEVAEKIRLYRESLTRHGHDPESGHVTLMLHTFIADDINFVREKVREPFCNYIKTFTGLLNNLAKSLDLQVGLETLTAADMDTLLSFAFERYFNTSALFGTPSTCLQTIARLKAIGVDEVGCLIDFGVDIDSVLVSLNSLNELKERSNSKKETMH